MKAEHTYAEDDECDRGMHRHFGIRAKPIKFLNVVEISQQPQHCNKKYSDGEYLDNHLQGTKFT